MTVDVTVVVVVKTDVWGVVTVSLFVSGAVVLLDLEAEVCADVTVASAEDFFPVVADVVTGVVSVTGSVCTLPPCSVL